MRRVLQWTGLVGTIVVFTVLAWPEQADAGLNVESTALETPKGGVATLVIVTDEPQGRLVFGIENAEVLHQRHPDTPLGLSVEWDGSGMRVREGLGIRLHTAGALNGVVKVKAYRAVVISIETSDGAQVASLEVPTPSSAKAVTVEW